VSVLDGWRYCPRCAAELERRDDHLACPACGFAQWANSVPGAQALVEHDGRVLLGRRVFAPAKGLWDLPGGFLHEGELPEDGLRRELREETGLEVEPVEWVGAWNADYDGRVVLCLTWTCRVVGGDLRAADDIEELRWFAPGELPLDELAFPMFVEVLSLWRARQQHA
jgi:ADP-ribose pyrophosphatase YjhB (NUDIX family)